MFLGKFARTLDARNRITVPTVFQVELTAGAYMTQGFDRNVQVLTAQAFTRLYERAAALNLADPGARLLLRLVLGNAVDVPAGKSALAIPDHLREYAGLEGTALLVGQGDYFEIWSPNEWQRQEIQLRDAEANASRFAALALGSRKGVGG